MGEIPFGSLPGCSRLRLRALQKEDATGGLTAPEEDLRGGFVVHAAPQYARHALDERVQPRATCTPMLTRKR